MFKKIGVLTLAGMGLFSVPALAADRVSVEEIVVTATKREESVQDIPIAVSAFSGDDLMNRGIDDVNQLQQVSPSLLINTSNSTTNGGTMRIRGIGTTGNNVGLESAVGFFTDGIYRSRAGQALNELLDVQRIEVLRGPQGTLFGKNTSAGAVHVISNKPEYEFGGEASISGGNYEGVRASGVLNAPVIGDVLAFRLAGVLNKRDGWMDDVDDDSRSYDNRDRYALKGQMLWEPTDTISIRLMVDYMEKDESCCPSTFKIAGPTAPALRALGGDTTAYADDRVGVNAPPFEEVEDRGVSLDVNWDLGFAELVSITGLREFEVDRGQDVDFTNVDVYQQGNTVESFDNWSQEFRLVGTSEAFDWIIGAFLSGEEIKNQGRFLVLGTQGPAYFSLLFRNPAVAGLLKNGDGLSARFEQDADSWALYTNNTWHINEEWDLNFGLRYTEEEKEGGSVINETGTAGVVDNNWPCAILPIPTFCSNAGYSLKRNEDKLNGTVKLSWHFMEDASTYVSVANGYKAGGFNLDPTAFKINAAGVVIGDGREFEEETVESVELGLKSQWLDGTVTLNTALFFSKFEDFQLNTFTGAFFVVQNVPEVESKGIEVEYQWVPTEWLMLTGGVTYVDSRYTDDTPIVNATAPFGGPTNLEDKLVTNSPLWQASSGVLVDQAMPLLDGWRYTFNLNWAFRSKHNTGSDLDPQKRQDSYNLFNAQIGIRNESEAFELTLWGNNIFDEDYLPLTFDSVSQTGSWHSIAGTPRMYGVTLRTRF